MTKKAPSKKAAAHIPLRSFINPHSRLNRVLCGAGNNPVGCNSQNAGIRIGTSKVEEYVNERRIPPGKPPMTENAIGIMQVPVGVAEHFIVNGRATYVPVATLEPGVVAGMSHAAKLCARNGGFTAEVGPNIVTAQIRFDDLGKRSQYLLGVVSDLAKDELFKVTAGLPLQHHGMKVVRSHELLDELNAITIEVTFDTGEAMGANAATKYAGEYAKACAKAIGKRPAAVIVTNADQGPEVVVQARWKITDLRPGVAQRITQLSRWARYDSWRAATHNKGVMNGILGTALAAGQDVPAIAAAAAHEAMHRDMRGGEIGPLSLFTIVNSKRHGRMLHGVLRTRLPLGSVGGATHHRSSLYYRNIMCGGRGNSPTKITVKELAAVIGAAGLAANFASLRMLADEGVTGALHRLLAK